MNALIKGNLIDMPIYEVVPKFVCYAEASESAVANVRRVEDPEGIAVSGQHTRYPIL